MAAISQHPRILNEFAALVGQQHGLLHGADTVLLKVLEFNRTPASSMTASRLPQSDTLFTTNMGTAGAPNSVSILNCTILKLAEKPIPDFRIV